MLRSWLMGQRLFPFSTNFFLKIKISVVIYLFLRKHFMIIHKLDILVSFMVSQVYTSKIASRVSCSTLGQRRKRYAVMIALLNAAIYNRGSKYYLNVSISLIAPGTLHNRRLLSKHIIFRGKCELLKRDIYRSVAKLRDVNIAKELETIAGLSNKS